jgi:hypothetical protein
MKFKIMEYNKDIYNMKPDTSGKFNKGDYRQPAFNREKDYLESKASELEIRKYFISKGYEFVSEGGYLYDAMFKCTKEPYIVEDWAVKKYWTVEVKESFKSQLTGNVPIEFQQWGRSTGIAQTQADFWIEKIHEPNGRITFTMMKTSDLKKMIADKKYFRVAEGGDPGSESKVYLFKVDVFRQHGKTLNIKTY